MVVELVLQGHPQNGPPIYGNGHVVLGASIYSGWEEAVKQGSSVSDPYLKTPMQFLFGSSVILL